MTNINWRSRGTEIDVKTDGVNQQKGDYRRFLLSRLPQNSVGCELGVWKGDFSEEILRMVKPGKLYLIDPWSYQPEFSHEWYGGTIRRTRKIWMLFMNQLEGDS